MSSVRQPGEVVTDQIPCGEGPVWCPDGTLAVTSVSHGAVYRVDVASGAVTVVATTGGGANGLALASDGGFVVAQNGGIDLQAMGHVDDQPPLVPLPGGLQRVHPDGTVSYLTTASLQRCNDLVVAADGTIYFTDPLDFPGSPGDGRIGACRPDGRVEVLPPVFGYTNGIALDPDGTTLAVLVDDRALVRLADLGRGPRSTVVGDLGPFGGDGLCLDADGNYYVAGKRANGVWVFDRDGTEVGFLEHPVDDDRGFVTNCCFGGPEMRTLYATDFRRRQVFAWPDMPVPGLELTPWRVPSG